MSDFKFTDDERIFKLQMRGLAKDSEGREVLVGLTLEETAFFMNRSRKFAVGIREHETKKRWLELAAKHEAARFAVLASEHELEREKPTIQ